MGTATAPLPAADVRERLEEFVGDVVASMRHVRQRENALIYVRGLIEHGGRKSIQPTLFRMELPPARYESVQQFVADSPWDAGALVRACAERVVPEIDCQAYVLDDTGVVKDGKSSPGVTRQYSGTLGKVGNCQIVVSMHAVGWAGTQPVGFSLYLPEEWCDDGPRRARAKIPEGVVFRKKPELAAHLAIEAATWDIPSAPVLGDQAYGDSTALRTQLHAAQIEYVLAIGDATGLFSPTTTFSVPTATTRPGRPAVRARPDQKPESAHALATGLSADAFEQIAFTTGPRGTKRTGRFACVRVIAAHPVIHDRLAPREEWLIVEWPDDAPGPTDLWLSNLPPDTPPERLAQLARLRWAIELDYRQLKGELGLDHYEGRSYAGFHHHCALVACAYAFLTLERLRPKARRPT